MASISLTILEFLLSVIVFFGSGWTVFRKVGPDGSGGIVISASNLAALILMLLLTLQVFKVLPTCG